MHFRHSSAKIMWYSKRKRKNKQCNN